MGLKMQGAKVGRIDDDDVEPGLAGPHVTLSSALEQNRVTSMKNAQSSYAGLSQTTAGCRPLAVQ